MKFLYIAVNQQQLWRNNPKQGQKLPLMLLTRHTLLIKLDHYVHSYLNYLIILLKFVVTIIQEIKIRSES